MPLPLRLFVSFSFVEPSISYCVAVLSPRWRARELGNLFPGLRAGLIFCSLVVYVFHHLPIQSAESMVRG
jgi:hypothetical protein